MIFDMPSCGGCRTCEMVCSNRHTGKFNPSKSSIKIIDKEHSPGYKVFLLEKSEGCIKSCDGCKNLKEPLCVSYCVERDSLAKLIDMFLKYSENTG